MAKSYSEELGEWVRQRQSVSRQHRNLVAFLALKPDVAQALDDGWPVKTVWTHLREKKCLEFSYDTFLAYVRRHLRGQTGKRTPSPQLRPVPPRQVFPPARERAGRAVNTDRPAAPSPHALPGFTFNPIPNIEELF